MAGLLAVRLDGRTGKAEAMDYGVLVSSSSSAPFSYSDKAPGR